VVEGMAFLQWEWLKRQIQHLDRYT
jgi:hypothetical protein